MADDTPSFPQRRRPGQTYQRPSQEETDKFEDRARENDPRVKPRIDPRAANLITPEADAYRNIASALSFVDNALGTDLGSAHQKANMANVDKTYQANLTKLQGNLDELAKTDRNLAFSVADAISDGVRTENKQDKVEVKVNGQTSDVTQALALALGQDTLDSLKNMFGAKDFAFTDVSSGKTVAPSSNVISDTKIAEQAQPQNGRS